MPPNPRDLPVYLWDYADEEAWWAHVFAEREAAGQPIRVVAAAAVKRLNGSGSAGNNRKLASSTPGWGRGEGKNR